MDGKWKGSKVESAEKKQNQKQEERKRKLSVHYTFTL